MRTEKEKFRKFYKYGSLLWIILTGAYFTASYILTSNPEGTNAEFYQGILNIVLIFGIFGIPMIFILSLVIRLAEHIIQSIPKKQ